MWHENPRHSVHHFLVFGVLAVCLTLSLLTAIFSIDFGGDSQVASPIASATKKATANDMQGMTNQLFKAIELYVKADDRDKGVAQQQMEDLLTKRTEALEKLMEENPDAALREVLPAEVLASLPPDIAQKLEKYVTVEGVLSIRKFDYFDDGRVVLEFKVKDTEGKGAFTLRAPMGGILAGAGAKVRVKGAALGGNILFAGGTGGGLTITEPVKFSSTFSTGAKKVLLMMVNYSDDGSMPYSVDQMRTVLFTGADSLASHYNQNSFNKLTVTGDVVPNYIQLPYTKAGACGKGDQVIYDAEAGAQAQGLSVANYDLSAVATVNIGCGWGGYAYYPMSGVPERSIANMYGQPSFQEVVEHEFGHSFGQNHSATLSCGAQSVATTGCTETEYGDTLDPLGIYNGLHTHYNVAHKNGYGWMTTANVQNVTSSGTFTIAPLENSATGLQALRIAKADTGQSYYVGYRQPVGMDAGLNSNVMRGAGVWLINDTTQYPDLTRLLDMTPGDGNSVDSAALSDGQTFNDLANGLAITQISHDANGVTLQVTKAAAPCVPNASVGSVSPATQSAGVAGQALTYTVSIQNKNSSTCSPATYTLASGVSAGWLGTFSPATLTISPGSTGSATFTVTSPAGTANGSYPLQLQGNDSANAIHGVSVAATYVLFTDTTVPTVAITAPANGAALKGASATISANASDNVAVTKVEFYVDNKLEATDTASPYSIKWNIKKASRGAHTITVKAYDASGNVGTASVAVTI